MSIELAEKLKRELTDKWVIVDPSVPELKRFAHRTGRVKTVNMNGRALVEFDGAADIGWYDIDPAYLTVVDAPRLKAQPKEEKAPKESSRPASATPPAGKSPLELARAQGAAKQPSQATEPKPAATPAVAPSGEKLSPIELIRRQQAAKRPPQDSTPTPAVAAESAPTSAPEEPAALSAQQTPTPPATSPATAADGRKLSPLELARLQGPAKR
ncbi:MAG: hypothetical protein KatS3mg113_0717 [Planctomycetaceae bacterium]|nr:MAG: hypothetical protein KatS3mg113_0717 [Planctomycetaceae bacterium]